MNSNINLVPAYAGNPLIEAIGPILSELDIGSRIMHLPPVPHNLEGVPEHVRIHQLMSVLDLYIPPDESRKLGTTIDLLIYSGLANRAPNSPETWRNLFGKQETISPSPRQLAAALTGIAGTGKSMTVDRILRIKSQVIVHNKFPGLATPLHQLVWLMVDVPASGKCADLALSLMRATDEALGTDFFTKEINGYARNGLSMLHRWQQKVSSHFLGVLVLDEIQNLFKIQTKRVRNNAKLYDTDRFELRIKDDDMRKFILNLTNTNKRIPLLLMGTPDGGNTFLTRFSTSQRISILGNHEMRRAASSEDAFYRKYLFPELCKYQWVDEPIPYSEALMSHIHKLSGGVPRIYINLWASTQRRVLQRKGKALTFGDFTETMNTDMSLVIPAIKALTSGEPRQMRMYEDLMPKSNDSFWMELYSDRSREN